jgi:hypothetical protein
MGRRVVARAMLGRTSNGYNVIELQRGRESLIAALGDELRNALLSAGQAFMRRRDLARYWLTQFPPSALHQRRRAPNGGWICNLRGVAVHDIAFDLGVDSQ